MKVGDLVKIKDLPTSGIGIILKKSNYDYADWVVLFPTLGYDHSANEAELEVISESR